MPPEYTGNNVVASVIRNRLRAERRSNYRRNKHFHQFLRDYGTTVSQLFVDAITRDLRLRTPAGRVFVLRESSGQFFNFSVGAYSGTGPIRLSQIKRQYLTNTLRDIEGRVRRALKRRDTHQGKSSLSDAPADLLHPKPKGGFEALGVSSFGREVAEGGLFSQGAGAGTLSGSRSSGRNEPIKTSVHVTAQRGVLTITGFGIVQEMLGGLVYVPEGGFARENNKAFAMYKPETTDVVFRSRIYKKFGGRWIQRRGLLERLGNIGDVIGYGGQE